MIRDAINVTASIADYLVAQCQEKISIQDLLQSFDFKSQSLQDSFPEFDLCPTQYVSYISSNFISDFSLKECPLETLNVRSLDEFEFLIQDLQDFSVRFNRTNNRKKHDNLGITYGFFSSILGEILIAKTDVGVCWLGFLVDQKPDLALFKMMAYWPNARFCRDDKAIAKEGVSVMQYWKRFTLGQTPNPLKLDIFGTSFQILVWQRLLNIPFGMYATYQAVASSIGNDKASRAVGNAVGANPLSLIIPCHRVILSSGSLANYGWGSARKKLILGMEASLISKI